MLDLAHTLDDFVQPVLHVQQQVVPALRQRGHQSCKGQNGDEGSGLNPGQPRDPGATLLQLPAGREQMLLDWKLVPERAGIRKGFQRNPEQFPLLAALQREK